MNAKNLKLMPEIIRKVESTILRYEMLRKKDRVLVSVSGGPDSIFLAQALKLLSVNFELELICFHLDHMTRNGESALDASFVEDFCRFSGLNIIKRQIDAKAWCRENGLSFQEGARRLRIHLLSEAAEENNIGKIAVGHTADDSIETFLLNLLRGSGLKGLSGIMPVSGRLIRPLIETGRDEIIDYLKLHDIVYRTDRTNLENIYSRNKVRNMLIPYIKENLSKDFDKRLIRTIKNIREDDGFIEDVAMQCLSDISNSGKYFGAEAFENPGFLEIDLDKLEKYPAPLIRRILLCAVKTVKGNKTDIKSINIEGIFNLSFCSRGRKEIMLPSGLLAVRENLKLFLFKDAHALEEEAAVGQALTGIKICEGTYQTQKGAGLRIMTEIINGGMDFIKDKKISSAEAYLDYDRISFPVTMRFWEGLGEKFFPLGLGGQKKLQDFFVDKKIPVRSRKSIPLFFDNEKIIWVAGYEIDDRVRLTLKTGKIFHIKIFKI